MQHPVHSTSLVIGLLGIAMLLGGCDKIPGLGKPADTPAPLSPAAVPVVVAPPVAAPVTASASVVAATEAQAKSEPSLEVRSHIKQAFTYISMAKNARDGNIRDENIDNALKEFSVAIQKDPNYAEAYSNRAATYMQQKKFNKAEEDLRRAKELAPDSPFVRYNYASLHSLKGDVDLALDEIDAALTKGFSDYDALRRDPDLDNLRKHPEFRKILEKHKVFIVK